MVQNNLTEWISADELGIYTLSLYVHFMDGDGDGWSDDPRFRFKGEIHYPFDSPTYGSGNVWQGVAPQAHIYAVKVLDDDGSGWNTDIIAGIENCITNNDIANITVMSISIGPGYPGASTPSLLGAANRAVKNGIVTVVAAGNWGTSWGDSIGSPGDADMVITVAAMNHLDQLTSYSSQGGSAYPKNNTKPDITAPGGSQSMLQMYSADTGFDDAEGAYSFDGFANDTMPAQGTSMATPAVAGAANLLIQAMGGANKWDWTSDEKPRLVKSILLMTATELYPLAREGGNPPPLNRGGKDVHEGYGRMNIDAAIEAWTTNLTDHLLTGKPIRANITSSYKNPYGKHAYAGYINLKAGKEYTFNISVPQGCKKYDIYVYNSTSNIYGEPILNWYITDFPGDAYFNYTAEVNDKFFVVIKAVGPNIPAAAADDDDDDDKDTVAWDLIEFLSSPLGLLLVVGIVAAVVMLIVLIARREKEDYTYRPDYSY